MTKFENNSPDRLTAGYRQTNKLVLRLIAGIYFLAFVSLAWQVVGLFGSQGVFPAQEWLRILGEQQPAFLGRFLAHPTLFWIHVSDAWLTGACWVGALCALSAILGFFPLASFAICFLLYLSFYTACGPFLHFQWDLLLLESGFLAILAAPLNNWKSAADPPKSVPLLFRFLIFKLIFTSGLCKLASGDATWRTLTALHFYYETQPIPTWTSWYFHQLPSVFQKLSVLVMFTVELVFPLLIWAGRRGRLVAFWATVGFQFLILISGNYGFFNWLTIVLAVSLLDDERMGLSTVQTVSPRRSIRRITVLAATCLLVPASLYLTAGRWMDRFPRAAFVDRWIMSPLEAWPIVGAYGLFSVMTTQRREIVIEGSNDGQTWKEYEFRWKPGNPTRRPAFTGPHMPRLDWQMWFAALGTWRQNPWFVEFCRRILEGSPSVMQLIAVDPFSGHPPTYLRAVLYRYTFSKSSPSNASVWWERSAEGFYAPILSLKNKKIYKG